MPLRCVAEAGQRAVQASQSGVAGNEAAVHREKLLGDWRDPRGLSLGGIGVQRCWRVKLSWLFPCPRLGKCPSQARQSTCATPRGTQSTPHVANTKVSISMSASLLTEQGVWGSSKGFVFNPGQV